jgi:hypothetical protein
VTIQDTLTEACDLYRVWPDGTVQMAEDGAPYSWMSDDYALVLAADEADAVARSKL